MFLTFLFDSLTCTITLGQSGPRSNGNERYFIFPSSSELELCHQILLSVLDKTVRFMGDYSPEWNTAVAFDTLLAPHKYNEMTVSPHLFLSFLLSSFLSLKSIFHISFLLWPSSSSIACLAFFLSWNINLRGLFNAKSILTKGHYLNYLTQ